MKKGVRKAVIAGNWKMNKTVGETARLISEIKPLAEGAGCDVMVCVPFTDIFAALEAARGSGIKVSAQNCHWAESGAFTGEISAEMLADIGVEWTLIGHSERRQYFGETNITVQKRVRAALNAGLSVILCIGETLDEREQGITSEICALQLKIALGGVSAEEIKRIIIAYEPVWAIGTGKTATAAQAEEVCAEIRALLAKLYNTETAEASVIQYGGSMNASNADELLDKENVDGGLIGGASLKAADFGVIIKSASR
ncbi:MAG: triose-phosphate isomerase [Oscillospiraceae bacterium]|jgi:triosephosphate isomerase|nr:triose-phosphate isomerase [Oscillospiraceae bacterium]